MNKNYNKIKKFFSCKNPRDGIAEIFYVMANLYSIQKNYELSIKYFETANKNRKELVDYDFKSEEKLFKSIKNYFEKIDINNFKKK